MEKEQKKLLLVAVSVGVFLLVTITVAIIIMSPRPTVNNSSFASSQQFPTGHLPPVIPSDGLATTPIQNPSGNPLIVNTQETNINIDIDRNRTDCGTEETDPVEIAFDSTDGENISIHIPRPTTAAVPDTPDPGIVQVAPVQQTTQRTQPAAQTTTPRTTQPAATPRATTPAAARTTTPRQTTPAAARPSVTRTVNDFWVQTGAFSSKVRAEDAREMLSSKGLVSLIETREVRGQTWYRVRLGPYTSENEANYWLSLVKSIDGFGESQVRQTARAVN